MCSVATWDCMELGLLAYVCAVQRNVGMAEIVECWCKDGWSTTGDNDGGCQWLKAMIRNHRFLTP